MRSGQRRPAAEEEFASRMEALRRRAPELSRKDTVRRVARSFRAMCLEVAPTVAVEIGAHEASFSRRLKKRLPATRVVAYEANPYVYRKYREVVAAAGVEYLHLAVGPESGTLELTIPLQQGERVIGPDNFQASMMRNPVTVRAETVVVPSVRLDEHLRLGAEEVLVAWIDVEGANGPVLESARGVLPHLSLLHIEVERVQRWAGQWLDVDVARFLDAAGFVPVLRDRARPRQYNVVFVREELAGEPWVQREVDRAYATRGGA